jgi:hypothetical protein
MTGTTRLGGLLADHVTAMSACDGNALVGAFADDALVNGAHRQDRWAAAGRSPKPATTAEECRRGRRR